MTGDFFPPAVPRYRFDPSLAFPELPPGVQSTEDATRAVSSICVMFAYFMAGHYFTNNSLKDIPYHEVMKECEDYLLAAEIIPIERAASWAESLLIPPEELLSDADFAAVPRSMIKKEAGVDNTVTFHPYQLQGISWGARRKGGVYAMACGIGKTGTAVGVAITMARLQRVATHRCIIVCPVNATQTWVEVRDNLTPYYQQVEILSSDGTHKWQHMESSGGLLILDEAHHFKSLDSRRTKGAMRLRYAFDACLNLTATLLHTGPEGALALQDLACPGLSRFCDKWSYGDAFHCIAQDSSYRNKKIFVKLPADQKPAYAHYLARSVYSLDYQSPSVLDVLDMPERTQLYFDTWAKPAWVEELMTKDAQRMAAELKAKPAEKPRPVYYWPPDLSQEKVIAMTALALGNENRMVLAELMKQTPDDEELLERARKAEGIPTFLAAVQAVMKLGRFDMIIRREGSDFHFLYAPGSDALNPKPGPKIKAVEDWLREHPGEPALIGAYGVPTITTIAALLTSLGVEFRLIRGSTDKKDRKIYNDEFQAGKFPIMLVQQRAGSESVQLHRAHWSMLVDHGLSPITYEQFIGRTWRQGQKEACMHIDMCFVTFQRAMVKNLIAGDEFDTQVRQLLEREVNYQTNIMNPTLL